MTRTDKDVKAGWVTWFCVRVSAFFLRMRSTNLLSASDEQMADDVDGALRAAVALRQGREPPCTKTTSEEATVLRNQRKIIV